MVIQANGQSYLTTSHAEAKMILLNLSAEDIAYVIENSEFYFTADGDDFYRLELGGREIGVVIIDDERIRTVFVIE